MIAEKLREAYPNLLISTNFFLAPVPLHSSRRRWRGFNQAEILCQALAEELSLPIMDVLVRNKSTKTQKDLKKEQRMKNVANVFALSPKILNPGPASARAERDGSAILNQNFILVDDVATTGATLQEAAKILKRNGAAKVICLTVARD